MAKLEARWALRLMSNAMARVSRHFHVLWKQFLLRIIDLEALSIEADVEQYIGQFAGVLLMISLMQALGNLVFPPPLSEAWKFEQSHILTMMLIVGLIAVLTWDGQFPDRRDALILGPLPIRPRTILFAKLAATAAPIGLAILLLNGASSPIIALLFARTSNWPRFFFSYWFTMIACSLFLLCTLLAIQGVGAALLPRRLYIRLSGLLQLGAYATVLSAYFLLPTLPTHASMVAVDNLQLVGLTPSYWFFAMLNQLNGSLPADMQWLAWRGWLALGASLAGALASLLICYSYTMRKIVEQPELIPSRKAYNWRIPLGSSLTGTLLAFCWRTLTRSRQHRIILAFYLSIAFAVWLAALHRALIAPGLRNFSIELPITSTVMMVFVVMGFRNIFALPISLTANWILRTTQLRPSARYITAVRRTLLLLSVLPVLLVTAAMGLTYRPLTLVAGHLVLLTLLGIFMVDASLAGFAKVPFTCSLLPGSANFQFTFWATFGGLTLLLAFLLPAEVEALHHPQHFLWLVGGMAASCIILWTINRWLAAKAELYFEELPEEMIMTLGL